MSDKLQLTIRTVTRDRQANIAAPPNATISEILTSARQNWNLSGNYEYIMRSERMGVQFVETMTLQQAGVLENDILEIQPLADAGFANPNN